MHISQLFLFVTKDDITGDGTTSNVLIIGELLKQVSKVNLQVSCRVALLSLGFTVAWTLSSGFSFSL